MKKVLSNVMPIVMMFVMIFTLVIPAKAAELDQLIKVRLNQADKGNVPITANGPLTDDIKNNPLSVDGASASDASFAFWVFIANSGPSDHADITFLLPNGTTEKRTFEPSVQHNQNDHYNIITPVGYKVLDGYAYYSSGNNQVFTLSHSYATPNQPKGSLDVTVNVVKQHEKVTYQPIWQKELQPVYQKVYQPVWQKVIQPVWQREIQPVWQKEIQPIWQKEFQPYNAPTFKRETSSATQNTLVTRLSYSDNTINAYPTNGGAFGNGQTYVKLDVAKASAPGGVWYTIADSSPNNGKKTPGQYNIPIDYKYNVQITNGKLTISLDKRLISASVGAYVVNDITKFPGNAPKHSPNTVTVDVPTPTKDGFVYLYTHFEGGIKWYTTGEYNFAGWKLNHTDMVKDALVENKLVSDSFVRNDIASDKFVRNDLVSDDLVRNDFVREDFIRNDVASDEFVRNDLVGTETITDPYNTMFDMMVIDNNGQIVYNGQIANHGEVVISNLNSGLYYVNLHGDDIGASISKTVTVTAPNQATVAFDDIPAVIGPVENVYLDKTYLPDIIKDKIYLDDKYLDKIYLDDQYLEKTYLDDIILDKTYLDDTILDKIYLDDIHNAPINIGNETDAFGKYFDPQEHEVDAIRLN